MTELSAVQAVVLGLVQGLTEFIPISSTAHLRIVPALLGWADPGAAFSAVIQLGTLAAVLVYFARDIGGLTLAALRGLGAREAWRNPSTRLAWGIAAGNVPIVVLGLSFRHTIETELRSLYIIAAMLALVALGLWAVERRRPGGLHMGGLTLGRILVVGAFQALALIPGASRSGSTILGGLLVGLRRPDAARFSFLLGIPAIGGAGLLELPKVIDGIHAGALTASTLALGLVTAGVSGYASIAFLLHYLRTRTTLLFVVYRLLLAALVVGLTAAGWVV